MGLWAPRPPAPVAQAPPQLGLPLGPGDGPAPFRAVTPPLAGKVDVRP